MANFVQLQKLASSHFAAEVTRRCTSDQRQLIEHGSFSTTGQLIDSKEGRSLLSAPQLNRLISLGLMTQRPSPRPRGVKGVGECIWRFADPTAIPNELPRPEIHGTWPGKIIYHAIVIGATEEVLGEWRLPEFGVMSGDPEGDPDSESSSGGRSEER